MVTLPPWAPATRPAITTARPAGLLAARASRRPVLLRLSVRNVLVERRVVAVGALVG
jgi:hypothetical protein